MTEFEQLLEAIGAENDENIILTSDRDGAFAAVARGTVAEVIEAAKAYDAANLWFSVQPVRPGITSGRGTAADVTALRCVYAELDYKDDGCGSEAAARQVIHEVSQLLGSRPASITHSGHGLHPIWPVEQDERTRWTVEASHARDEAANLLRRFGNLVQTVASQLGVKVDSVWDLPRVLRVPGTMNLKAEPVAVRLELADGRPVALEEISDACDALDVAVPEDLGRSDGVVVEGLSTDTRRVGYVRAALQRLVAELRELANLPVGAGLTNPNDRWDIGTARRFWRGLELAHAVGIDDHVVRDLLVPAAPTDRGFTPAKVAAKWAAATLRCRDRAAILELADEDELPVNMFPDAVPSEAERAARLATVGEVESLTVHETAVLERLEKLRIEREARALLSDELAPDFAGIAESRGIGGDEFVLDLPDELPLLWGSPHGAAVMISGEALMIASPPGVGKTTLNGLLVRGFILGGTEVLGEPVARADVVVYLAMDRPQQIARALSRQLSDIDRDVLRRRLHVWRGPLPGGFVDNPRLLIEVVESLIGAINGRKVVIVVDSLKDAVQGMTDDEKASAYNIARQTAVSEGLEIIELHHMVKRGVDGAPPKDLAGVYGSVWLTAGVGSVVLLWGQAGDPIVRLSQLKTLTGEEFGPGPILFDHRAGTVSWYQPGQLYEVLRANPGGMTAVEIAKVTLDVTDPTPSQIEKSRRAANALVKQAKAYRHDGSTGGSDKHPTRWTALTQFSDSLIPELAAGVICRDCGTGARLEKDGSWRCPSCGGVGVPPTSGGGRP